MEKAREEAAKAVKEAAMADTGSNNLTTEVGIGYDYQTSLKQKF